MSAAAFPFDFRGGRDTPDAAARKLNPPRGGGLKFVGDDGEGALVLFYLFLITLLTTLVSVCLLWYMIKKFYWGPTGRPPQYRYHGDDEPARPARRKTLSNGNGRG